MTEKIESIINEEKIIYKYIMKKAPTSEDGKKYVGFEGFKKKLEEKEWIGIGGIALKPFSVKYRGNVEEGNNYIEGSHT